MDGSNLQEISNALARLGEGRAFCVLGYTLDHVKALIAAVQPTRTKVIYEYEPLTVVTGNGPIQAISIRAIAYEEARQNARAAIKNMKVGETRVFNTADERHLFSIHNAIKYLHRVGHGEYNTRKVGDTSVQVSRAA